MRGDAGLVLALLRLAEQAVGHFQCFKRTIRREQATVEAVDRHAAESGAVVHRAEQAQQFLPDRPGRRIEERIVGAADQEVLQQLGREGQLLAHVLAEENEQESIQDLLRQAHQPSARSGETRSTLAIMGQQLGVKPVT